jgi:uncharacterized protein YegP (UPF0339 family)
MDLVSGSAYFETFRGLDDRFYFNVMAKNGENVLRSQGYTSLDSAQKGVESILRSGHDARQYEIRAAKNGEHYFNLLAANGEIIGTSELYVSKTNAERGARTVRALVRLTQENGPAKPMQPQTQPAPRQERFEMFTGEDGQVYFRLRAKNGEILLGSEGYTSETAAKAGIASVEANGAEVSHFEMIEAAQGAWYVRLVAENGEIVARSESYASKANAERAAHRMSEILASHPAIAE